MSTGPGGEDLASDGSGRHQEAVVFGKRCARSWVLSLAAAAAAILVLPSAGAAAEPTQDSVVGFLDFGVYGSVHLDVRSGPGGEAPQGSLRETFGSPSSGHDTFESTSISCLAVNGSTAVVGGFGILSWYHLGPEGPTSGTRTTGFVAVVLDHGSPPPPPPDSPPSDNIDEYGSRYVDTPDCAAPGFTPTGWNTIGDFVVTDAPSVPTTKDQCKNGGWQRYGTRFKNHGQCVAFVERGPKP
jgi:hypothetical protein